MNIIDLGQILQYRYHLNDRERYDLARFFMDILDEEYEKRCRLGDALQEKIDRLEKMVQRLKRKNERLLSNKQTQRKDGAE